MDSCRRWSLLLQVVLLSCVLLAGKGVPAGEHIVFEEPDLPQPSEARLGDAQEVQEVHQKESSDQLPRVAILIDDMGYHKEIGDKLLALDMNLTFSFLPGAPHTLEQEERAWQKGREILVHMPMEARDPAWDPGPGALFLSYSGERIRRLVEENLKAVPHAVGSNNHMGSRFTEDAGAMREVLGVLKQQGMFFVDSYTTSKSTGLELERSMGIPTARRHVFLDNVKDSSKVCTQLEQLVALARKKGWAIGIGHPNQATLQALTSCRKQLLRHVRIVGVSALVR